MHSISVLQMPSKIILFISKGEGAASTRYRAIDFFDLFEKSGWQPVHITARSNIVSRLQILRFANKAHAVVIVRRTFGPLFARLIRFYSRRLVFSFDDAIFSRSNGKRSLGREKRFAITTSICDNIWAGNAYLADKALRYNKNVEIIPTAIDVERYCVNIFKSDSSLDLVWIGSQSTKKHLVTILPTLERAARLLPSLRLKVVSDFTLKSNILNIVSIAWSPEAEIKELASSHVGIAPLPDNVFTRGKCGLKVLQYMAAGIPVITSPTGVNADMVLDGSTGVHATTDREWVEAILMFSKSKDLCVEMGLAGRNRCLTSYSLEDVFNQMRAIL